VLVASAIVSASVRHRGQETEAGDLIREPKKIRIEGLQTPNDLNELGPPLSNPLTKRTERKIEKANRNDGK